MDFKDKLKRLEKKAKEKDKGKIEVIIKDFIEPEEFEKAKNSKDLIIITANSKAKS